MKIIITEKQLKTIIGEQYQVTATDDRPSMRTQTKPKEEDPFVKYEKLSWWDKVVLGVKSIAAIPERVVSYLISVAYEKMGLNPKSTKIRLIFPGSDWEYKAVNLLKTIGVVTGVYNSLSSAIKTVQALKDKNVKASELVIGSHGNGEKIIMTQVKDEYNFQTDFIKNLKTIITPNTVVFFTACYGANYLKTIMETARNLGVGIYSSAGLYNYIANESEKGHYFCSSNHPLYDPKNRLEKRNEIYPAYELDTYSSTRFGIKFYGINKNSKIQLIFDPKVFSSLGLKTPFTSPVSFIIPNEDMHIEEETYHDNNANNIYSFEFTTYWEDLKYGQRSFNQLKSLIDSGKIKKIKNIIKENGTNFKTIMNNLFKQNLVRITLDGKDVKQNKPINGFFLNSIAETNDYLLKTGICQKVSSPPVQWTFID